MGSVMARVVAGGAAWLGAGRGAVAGVSAAFFQLGRFAREPTQPNREQQDDHKLEQKYKTCLRAEWAHLRDGVLVHRLWRPWLTNEQPRLRAVPESLLVVRLEPWPPLHPLPAWLW